MHFTLSPLIYIIVFEKLSQSTSGIILNIRGFIGNFEAKGICKERNRSYHKFICLASLILLIFSCQYGRGGAVSVVVRIWKQGHSAFMPAYLGKSSRCAKWFTLKVIFLLCFPSGTTNYSYILYLLLLYYFGQGKKVGKWESR